MELPKIKDLKDLQAIFDLMSRNEISELEIEEQGQRIRVRKPEFRMAGEKVVYTAEPIPPPRPAQQSETGRDEIPAEVDDQSVVSAPLVGTFYRAPSPEADLFVQEGDRVDDDTVLCIIEAMKVMNEVHAGEAGVVREILVKNGEPVEFGQALFRLDTA